MSSTDGIDSRPEALRYAPAHPFPRYAFLPGRDPHPTRDPRGHSYGASEGRARYTPPDRWGENEAYLFGVDLYNHGYLWEAHEAWEGLWHASKHDAVQAELLQGLIQCTAAALKVAMEQPNGVERLGALGTARLQTVVHRGGAHFMGLDVAGFAERFRLFASSKPTSADVRPRIRLASQGT